MKKDSMMDKKQEEPTPDSQRVTWGNRVATILMIGVVWGVAFLSSSVFGHTWTLQKLHFVFVFLGSYVTTFGLVIALFAKHRQQQRWFRCFSWWVILPIPGIFVTALTQAIFTLTEEQAMHYGFLAGQLFVLGFAHLVYSRIQNRKLKNGNINTAK